MEERIRIILNSIEKYGEDAKRHLTESELTDEWLRVAELTSKKLENSLNRFQEELVNYFKFVSDPSADIISDYSTRQLQAEELSIELSMKIKGYKPNPENVKKAPGRIPKLSLPQFEGNVLQWQEFFDQYTSSIDERDLAEVDKLMYLKSCLRGAAKKAIEGLESTSNNYQIALTILKERFGKPTRIIDAHYAALSKLRPAGNSIQECREVFNEVERHLRVLNSLGEDTSHNHLRHLILEKFPEELIYEIKTKVNNEDIKEIRQKLEKVITSREEAGQFVNERQQGTRHYTTETLYTSNSRGWKSSDLQRRNNKNFNSHSKQKELRQPFKQQAARSMNNTVQKNNSYKRKFENQKTSQGSLNKKRRLECFFCKGSHYNDECDKFKTIQERKRKLSNRCYHCFRPGHMSARCRKVKKCAHCQKLHNRSLCPTKFIDTTNSKDVRTDKTNTLHFNTQDNTRHEETTILQTAITKAKKNGKDTYVSCRILLDSGSQRSYITENLFRKLKLNIEEESHLSVFTFGEEKPKEYNSPLVNVCLKTKSGNEITLQANVVPTISSGVLNPQKEFGKELGVSLADDGSLDEKIDILIGNDYYFSLIHTDKRQLQDNLFIVDSVFGWILSGKATKDSDNRELHVITYFQTNIRNGFNKPDLPLDGVDLKNLWDLESIGIKDSPDTSKEEEALKNFNDTTKIEDNRYAVCWPWKEYPPDLPTNFGMAFGRLVNLLKRLNSEALLAYDQTFKEQLKKGIIEEAPKGKSSNVIHYLSHHGVQQADKPVRIVYDASASTKDTKSLNQNLHCGPMMLEDLTGLIIKLRCHKIGISADIEKAFLQISLQERDRDVTRFLWLRDISKPATEENLLHLRFTRVPFGVISSPFLLNATVKHHLQRSVKERVRQLIDDIYVDNVVTGTNSVTEAKQLYNDAKQAFKQISMNLRDWCSNSKDFMESIPPGDSCKEKTVKILGLNWNLEEDELRLRFKNNNSANTKRGVLKVVASVYDPCGYAVPTLLPAKLLLQDLWKQNMKWDATFPKEIEDKWKEIQKDLNQIQEIVLPRRYFEDMENNSCQLHCFADASAKAYAAVTYIVTSTGKGFVMGKSRVTPIKEQEKLNIPRLELLAALIGSRLLKYTSKFICYNVTQKFLWTDSQIVIDWYNSDKLLTPFVARRIKEIKTENLIVRYVPTSLNPADVGTRLMQTPEDKAYWLSGPEFLLGNPNLWPTTPRQISSLLAGEGLPNNEESNYIDNHIEINKQIQGKTVMTKMDIPESDKEADLKEIQKLQKEHFQDEMDGKETNLKRNLGLYLDVDGILRCRGRLAMTSWSYEKKHPILLPPNTEYTDRIIKDTHLKNYHVGVAHTLSIIRERYWIPKGRSVVQKIIKKCPQCVKHGGGPFKLPETPVLPAERVKYSSPFTFTGVDYFGPLYIRDGTEKQKRWVCLFTCLAVRAIHMEIVADLSAEECLLALRRFVSTRGVPQIITSDNAPNFKLTAEILKDDYCVEKGIKWKFIPQLAPWHGGLYERMVALVKHCMRRTFQKHLMNDSQLATVIKEIEAVLNTRPLTYVSSDVDDVLRPSDFLTMRNCLAMKTSLEDNITQGSTTKIDLIEGWRRGQIILQEFVKMFSSQYLPSLRERYWHSHREPRVKSKERPQIGQLVQLKEDIKNREGWKTGRIISLVKSGDGLCRVAKVKVGNKEYIRSIAHLYPLEMEEDLSESSIPTNNNSKNYPTIIIQDSTPVTEEKGNNNTSRGDQEEISDMEVSDMENNERITVAHDSETLMEDSINCLDDEITPETQQRPRRAAATKALEKIREWTQNLVALL